MTQLYHASNTMLPTWNFTPVTIVLDGKERLLPRMSRLFYIASTGLLLSSMLTAQKDHSAPQGLPPLIDRELLFGDPEITAAEVSPDGKYLAFMKPWSKTRNIWVKKTEEPFSAAKLLTTETKRPVAG